MHDVMYFVPVFLSARKMVNILCLHISSDEHCVGLVFTDNAGRHGLEFRHAGSLFHPRFMYYWYL